jgi:hypothetical protein
MAEPKELFSLAMAAKYAECSRREFQALADPPDALYCRATGAHLPLYTEDTAMLVRQLIFESRPALLKKDDQVLHEMHVANLEAELEETRERMNKRWKDMQSLNGRRLVEHGDDNGNEG